MKSVESACFANDYYWFCFVVPGSPHNVETMLESEVFTVSWMEVSIDVLLVERIHARNQTNCAFCDKSMKLGTWFLDILRSILRNGAVSDLTFGDL